MAIMQDFVWYHPVFVDLRRCFMVASDIRWYYAYYVVLCYIALSCIAISIYIYTHIQTLVIKEYMH